MLYLQILFSDSISCLLPLLYGCRVPHCVTECSLRVPKKEKNRHTALFLLNVCFFVVFYCFLDRLICFILSINLLSLYKRITYQHRSVQIFTVHIHSRDLTVFICRIIINPLRCIAAGRIDRDLILSISHMHAAALLCDRTVYMEKLADAL